MPLPGSRVCRGGLTVILALPGSLRDLVARAAVSDHFQLGLHFALLPQRPAGNGGQGGWGKRLRPAKKRGRQCKKKKKKDGGGGCGRSYDNLVASREAVHVHAANELRLAN